MPDLNKVFLMGRLTFDPKSLARIPSGTAVTESSAWPRAGRGPDAMAIAGRRRYSST